MVVRTTIGVPSDGTPSREREREREREAELWIVSINTIINLDSLTWPYGSIVITSSVNQCRVVVSSNEVPLKSCTKLVKLATLASMIQNDLPEDRLQAF